MISNQTSINMTKIIMIITFFICCNFLPSYSQQEDKKDDEKKWQAGININTVEPVGEAGFYFNALGQPIFINGHWVDKSYNLGAFVSCKIKENCILRLSLKRTQYHSEESRDFREFYTGGTPTDYEIDSVNVIENVLSISPGILWDWNYKRISAYGGFQAVYKNYGELSGTTVYSDWNSLTNDTIEYQIFRQKEPGGFSLGFGLIAGLSFHVCKSLYLGGEFSSAYSYYQTGGRITTNYTDLKTNSTGVQWTAVSFKGFRFSSVLSSLQFTVKF